MNNLTLRKEILLSVGAGPQQIQELLEYNTNPFDHKKLGPHPYLLKDEPHINDWMHYYNESQKIGAIEVLKKHFVQLNFPIERGISKTNAYIQATQYGKSISEISEAIGLNFEELKSIKIYLHPGAVGCVPAIIIGNRNDFVTLVRVFAGKNETANVPDSMGACMIKGFTNWGRVNQYQKNWEKSYQGHQLKEDWAIEFQKLQTQPELYQDRFMLISKGPYSSISAEKVGLKEVEWAETSATLRIHHENTHYCTLRIFGNMNINLLDEIFADYMGLRGAIGYYRADWYNLFMGIENYPEYRKGGRMENYCPNMSAESFKIMQKVMIRAAQNLEKFDQQLTKGAGDAKHQAALILTVTKFTMEELAAEDASDKLKAAYKKYSNTSQKY